MNTVKTYKNGRSIYTPYDAGVMRAFSRFANANPPQPRATVVSDRHGKLWTIIGEWRSARGEPIGISVEEYQRGSGQ